MSLKCSDYPIGGTAGDALGVTPSPRMSMNICSENVIASGVAAGRKMKEQEVSFTCR